MLDFLANVWLIVCELATSPMVWLPVLTLSLVGLIVLLDHWNQGCGRR